MKIAIVRGAFLNPFECQLYAPLATRHDVTLLGADWQFYSHAIAFNKIRVIPLHLWAASLSKIHASLTVIANRFLSWTLGRSFGFYDLNAQLGEADVIHSAETFFTMSYQSAQIAQTRQKPLVLTVSENLVGMGEAHPIRRERKRKTIEAASHFVAITNKTRDMLIQEGITVGKITVIPWSLDLNRFKPAPKDASLLTRLNLKADDFVVLFIGRLIPEKGIHEILSAIPGIISAKLSKPVRFVFVGNGPLLSDIQSARQRFPDYIRHHASVPYDQLPAMHNLADLFILPSKPGHKISEQFGFVLIESMACQKPVITTSVGSIEDVVGDCAKVIEPGRTDLLEKALLELLQSDAARSALANKGFERVRARYDAQKNAALLETVYRSAIESAS